MASTPGQDRVLSLMFFVAEHAPRLLHALAGVLGRVVWRLSPGVRSAVRSNLKRVLADRSGDHDRVGRAMLGNFVRFVADLGAARHQSAEALVARVGTIEGAEHYDRAVAMGRGLIVATAHLGSFEVGLAVTAARSSGTHVVFATDPFPRFDRMRRRVHEKLGVHEARAEAGWPMWVGLRDALSRGEVVVMQADRLMPGQKGASVMLCGAAAAFPTGPVRLAELTGAPIVPVFAVLEGGGRIKLLIDEPIVVGNGTGGRTGQHAAMQLLADVIGRRVSAYPEQWLMMHRVWPEREHARPGDERQIER